MRIPLLTIIAFVTLTSLASAGGAAQGLDLTGHWDGKINCKGFDEIGKFSDNEKGNTLDVSPGAGHLFTANIDGGTYNGTIIPDAKKPDVQGEVVLIKCTTNSEFAADDTASEIIRAKVKTKVNSDKGSFSGLSIFEINDPMTGGQTIETCKLSFKRTNSSPPAPAIAACGP